MGRQKPKKYENDKNTIKTEEKVSRTKRKHEQDDAITKTLYKQCKSHKTRGDVHQVLYKGKHVLLPRRHPSHYKWESPAKSQIHTVLNPVGRQNLNKNAKFYLGN